MMDFQVKKALVDSTKNYLLFWEKMEATILQSHPSMTNLKRILVIHE